MTRSNRRREDETKPARRRHDERVRRLRPDDPLGRAGRARPDGFRDDDLDDDLDLQDVDDDDQDEAAEEEENDGFDLGGEA